MKTIGYQDTIYVVEISSSAFDDDECATEYVLGVFVSPEAAMAHISSLFGLYGEDKFEFHEEDDEWYIEDPLPGIFSIHIRPYEFNVMDDKYGMMILRNCLRNIRGKEKEEARVAD